MTTAESRGARTSPPAETENEAAAELALEALRTRWEDIERRAAASGDLDRLHDARRVLRRLGRVER